MLASSLSLLFGIALLAPTWPATGDGVHPSDAPDVDLRIRIERDEVRYDIAMNLGFVDEVIEIVREDDERLHPVEYEGLRYALEEHLKAAQKVTADGVVITPEFVDFEVEQADMSLLPLFPRLGTKALIKARMVLRYSLKNEAQRIGLSWGDYPPDYLMQMEDMPAPPMEIKAVLSVMGDDRRLIFSKAQPSYTWVRSEDSFQPRFAKVPPPPLRERWELPGLSLGLGGAALLLLLLLRRRPAIWLGPVLGLVAIAIVLRDVAVLRVPAPFGNKAELPDAAQARAVFEPLHANIYRAFDYSKEGDIYDALARSVEGEYLEQLYRQVYESLVMRDEGGAMSRVQSVEQLSFELLGTPPRRGSARTRRRGELARQRRGLPLGARPRARARLRCALHPARHGAGLAHRPARGPGHTAQADAREPRDADSAARA
jgi:hypothetical protein